MLHRNQITSTENKLSMILDMILKFGLSTHEQTAWVVALSRSDEQQLSDIYQSIQSQPKSITVLTEEVMKAVKKQG